MLDAEMKARIDSARDILVGKVPDPKSQVGQITIALIYKFMDDMDRQSEELGGKAAFSSGTAVSLSGLVTLSNYDRHNNDNVGIPFASGCQSIWTIPYKEIHTEKPKGVVGSMDPAMRKYLPRRLFLSQ